MATDRKVWILMQYVLFRRDERVREIYLRAIDTSKQQVERHKMACEGEDRTFDRKCRYEINHVMLNHLFGHLSYLLT